MSEQPTEISATRKSSSPSESSLQSSMRAGPIRRCISRILSSLSLLSIKFGHSCLVGSNKALGVKPEQRTSEEIDERGQE